MSEPPKLIEMLARPQRIWGYVVLFAGLLFATGGAICGYSGLMKTEYKTGPGDQAILVGLSMGIWGVIFGIVAGSLVDLFRRWRWSRRRTYNIEIFEAMQDTWRTSNSTDSHRPHDEDNIATMEQRDDFGSI